MGEADDYVLFRDAFELIPERSGYAMSRITVGVAVASCALFPAAAVVGLSRDTIWDAATITAFAVAFGVLLCAKIFGSRTEARGWDEAICGYTTLPHWHPDLAQVDPIHGYVVRNPGTPLLTPRETRAAWRRAALRAAEQD